VTIRVPENATGEPRALSTNNLAHHIAVDEHQIQVGQRFGVDLYEGERRKQDQAQRPTAQARIAPRPLPRTDHSNRLGRQSVSAANRPLPGGRELTPAPKRCT
jgi:hypothetical protein